jgi:IMP cyclohydrolase
MFLLSDYPGRIIIVGKANDDNVFALYAITGRSSASRARKLVLDEKEKTIFVVPTNEVEIEKGNRELLIYPAIWWNDGIVVSNGKQTESIINSIVVSVTKRNRNAREILENGLSNWTYEPDEPHFTPRISAYINENNCTVSILKRNTNGNEERNFFDIELQNNRAAYISTYNGENINPLPSFMGEPREIIFHSSKSKDLCEELFTTLNEEFRVATASVMKNSTTNLITAFIFNNNN